MLTAGVDVGSVSCEVVLLKAGKILSYSIIATGASSSTAGRKALQLALDNAGVREEEIGYIVATGYGRISVDFANKAITEISCHARGASWLFPKVRTVIDIGGQDSKVIRVGDGGKAIDFVMNDKCAAGTGRFLEVMARAMEVDLEMFSQLFLKAREAAKISSTCTVFAESEVVSLIAEGMPREKIIRGLHESIANKILSMIGRVGLQEPVVMTGGVAKNYGAREALSEKLKVKLLVPEEPQIVGALGAALLAQELGRNRSTKDSWSF